ncbi:MAG TPA: hypothetical protein VEA61_15380 [Allosphingosinicella sp.]|nr:hypothetical protein [Allosphingosinicella sp.]
MRSFLLLAVLLAAGCTHSADEPLSLVDNPYYQALGHSPRWTLAIGDEDIALRLGHDNFPEGDTAFVDYRFPRRGARHIDGGRRWHSTRGDSEIIVEATPGPCDLGHGDRFEDVVRVRLGSREYRGCGGRLLREGRS